MSNTVNVGNFSVECFHSLSAIRAGTVLTDFQNIILTLVPDSGFSLDADNFSVILPYPDFVSNVVFSQSAINVENVLCTVTLIPGSIMPTNDIIIDLCIKGLATTADTTVSGTVTYAQAINVTPSTLNATYSAPGNFGQTKNVFTQVVSAAPGTYFVSTPVIAITSGNMADYSVSYSHVTNAQNQIISTTIEVFYTFGSASVTGDSWEIAAVAFAPSLKIDSYSFNSSVLPQAGDLRTYTVNGDPGASYVLTSDQNIFSGTNTYNGLLDSTGSESVDITFPAVTENETYSITIDGIFSGSFSQQVTVSLDQYISISVTYNTFTARSISVSPGNFTSTGLSKQPGTLLSLSFNITNNTGNTLIALSPITDAYIINLPEYPITFDGGGSSDVQKVTDVTGITAGMSFYDTNLPDGVTVLTVDAVSKEITFSDTITVLNNSTETLSLANNNQVFLTNVDMENDPADPNNWTLTSEVYTQAYGWDDVTFTFDLDAILVVPDPPPSVTTQPGTVGADPITGSPVLIAGGTNINANGGTIQVKGIQAKDTTAGTEYQFYNCNCSRDTSDFTAEFPLLSGHSYEYNAYVSNIGSVGVGATLTYTHP
jgi:hypothetical protein